MARETEKYKEGKYKEPTKGRGFAKEKYDKPEKPKKTIIGESQFGSRYTPNRGGFYVASGVYTKLSEAQAEAAKYKRDGYQVKIQDYNSKFGHRYSLWVK